MTSLLASANHLRLHSEQDALDVISSGLPACIFFPDDLHPEFFDLSNRIAGGIFQKLVNYNFRVAIVLEPSHAYGDRITELVRDHRAHPCIRFHPSLESALQWLTNGA